MTQSYNPTDLRAQEHAASLEDDAKRIAREQEIADFKWLMAHRQGRRFVWRLLVEAGLYRTSMASDDRFSAFLEGKKQIGYLLKGEGHEICLGRYHEMEQEQLDDARRTKR